MVHPLSMHALYSKFYHLFRFQLLELCSYDGLTGTCEIQENELTIASNVGVQCTIEIVFPGDWYSRGIEGLKLEDERQKKI